MFSAGCMYSVETILTLKFCGEGKGRNEFAAWHVAWLAEWHNYADRNICRMTQRNK